MTIFGYLEPRGKHCTYAFGLFARCGHTYRRVPTLRAGGCCLQQMSEHNNPGRTREGPDMFPTGTESLPRRCKYPNKNV